MNKKALSAALCCAGVCLSWGAYANEAPLNPHSVDLKVTPHELALVQVLSEICPPLLNPSQRQKFDRVYQNQLQAFMPNLNAAAVMQQIGSQSGYRAVLSGIRSWTLSYPAAENQALCVEFSEMSF